MIVVVIGCSYRTQDGCFIIDGDTRHNVPHVNPYLYPGKDVFVERSATPLFDLPQMTKGNYYGLSEGLLLDRSEKQQLTVSGLSESNIRVFKGGAELARGSQRWCLWFPEAEIPEIASNNDLIRNRLHGNRRARLSSTDLAAQRMAQTPHQFREMNACRDWTIAIPNVSSERRPYLPVTLENRDVVFPNTALALYDAPLYSLSVAASRLHLVWIASVCGKLKTDFRYSNTLGWNTFPVPTLTDKNKTDLIRCAENILLAREAHFPATIADLYNPSAMPDNLRHAHEKNDETLERIYIGRRFRNDTERLEKLFDLYARMIADKTARKSAA